MNHRSLSGAVLKRLRASQEITQKVAAERCGVPLITWKCWEQDRRGLTRLQLDEIRRKLLT